MSIKNIKYCIISIIKTQKYKIILCIKNNKQIKQGYTKTTNILKI